MTVTETKTPEKTELTKLAAAAAETEDKPKLFNVTQIVGGALAAVTTAAVGSRLGYAGTLVGAGIASVLAAFASTLYTKGLERTRDGVRKIVLRDADGHTKVLTVPDEDQTETRPKKSGWRRPLAVFGGIAATAAVTFVVAMGVVTGWEFGTGQTLDGRTGTTIGQVSNRQPSTKPTPSASATASPTATPTATETATPTATPTATDTPSPTHTPSVTAAPSQTPTDASGIPVGD